jgi:hypothetical protein
MSFGIMDAFSSLVQRQAVDEILRCNEYTAGYGLTLSLRDAAELAETRERSLQKSGRIEFNGSAVDKIIKEFCDSPYISMHNYVETLNELIDIFYCYKNETLDLISDDDLIRYMKQFFDGKCQGSLELLSGKALDDLAQNLRFGRDPDHSEKTGYNDDDGEYAGDNGTDGYQRGLRRRI